MSERGVFMKSIFFIFLISFFNICAANAARKFDLNFNFGPSLAQSGNISELGEPNYSTGFGFNYFFKEKHGMGLSFTSEYDFDGNNDFQAVDNASISTFDLHYAFRHTKDKFQFVFEPGLGWQTIYSRSTDPYWGYVYMDDISTGLIVDYKLFARYLVTDFSEDANFYFGLGLIHIFSMNDELAGQDITGNRLSMLFQIGLGW
jgi:hypothetical protein